MSSDPATTPLDLDDYIERTIKTIRQHQPEQLREGWWTGAALALADEHDRLVEEVERLTEREKAVRRHFALSEAALNSIAAPQPDGKANIAPSPPPKPPGRKKVAERRDDFEDGPNACSCPQAVAELLQLAVDYAEASLGSSKPNAIIGAQYVKTFMEQPSSVWCAYIVATAVEEGLEGG